MTSEASSRERVETALRGGRPDRVPIYPMYNAGYTMLVQGKNVRDWVTADFQQQTQYMEGVFLRHAVDGLNLYGGSNQDFFKDHAVERHPDHWTVTHRATQERFRLLPDGTRQTPEGNSLPQSASSRRVEKASDIAAVCPPIVSVEDYERTNMFGIVRHMVSRYPNHHFSFQLKSPITTALDQCLGFEEGLALLASEPELFAGLMARLTEGELPKIQAMKQAGARSALFTTYYGGADTIAPLAYRELVFPWERRICQAAREAGLFVIVWYLSELMSVLDTVMQLPIDALMLEPGRKGYVTDPVAVRRATRPDFCLFGFAGEQDFCRNRQEALAAELRRQWEGAGRDGAFIAGTPVMPPDAIPEAVDFYFAEARLLGQA